MAKPAAKPKTAVQADFYLNFSGSIPQANVDEPKLGETVEFTVLGTVRHVGDSMRDDNETRHGVKIAVEAAWPKGAPRPENANQALMFDHNGDATDDATGASDDDDASADEGDEIRARHDETGEWSYAQPDPRPPFSDQP